MNFIDQRNIFNPEENNVNVVIIGAGSTGSFLTMMLAKMGIMDVTVIDYDKVEEKNLCNQLYGYSDVGKNKVDALKDVIKNMSGITIKAENVKVDENYEFVPDMNTIYVTCVDNVETRKTILSLLENYPVTLIDPGFNAETFGLHCYDMSNHEHVEECNKRLELPVEPPVCGMKGITYTICSLASEISVIIKKMSSNNENKPPMKIVRGMLDYEFIHREREKEALENGL